MEHTEIGTKLMNHSVKILQTEMLNCNVKGFTAIR
jgi:hypothetical protein